MVVQFDKSLHARLVAKASECGFAACGVASADAAPETAARLREWLAEGRHGEMIWMEARADHRESPAGLWPEVRSVIALGMSYAPARDPLALAGQGGIGRISTYAQGSDYHDVVKRALKALARWLVVEVPGIDLKVFVDTAPLMEKPLAETAGLGWQGKHTNLVSRRFGSWLFLGSILTTLELEPDAQETASCGSCTACLDVCPTNAFPAPYQLDARACLSYLTIEFGGPWPEPFREAMGNRVYGCDDCLAVCPWNKFAASAREQRLQARDALRSPSLADLAALGDAGFRELFAKGPVKRIGWKRFLRNLLYAIGNSGDPGLIAAAQPHGDDADPVVADAARWAVARLSRGAPPSPG